MEGYFLSFMAELIIVAGIGTFAGSFLNVVALAIPDYRKILIGRSACPKCKEELKWYELIPIFSYLIQYGKCRKCTKKIASSYLFIEIATAIIYGLTYIEMSPILLWWQFILLLIIISAWVVIYLYDARTMYIQDQTMYLSIFLAVILQWTRGITYLSNAILAAVIAAVFLLLLRFLATKIAKQEAMGVGDIYIGAMIGLMVGTPNIYVALFLSFIIGSLMGLSILYQNKGKNKYTTIAFAPALVLGGFFALLYGQQIVNWYLGYYL